MISDDDFSLIYYVFKRIGRGEKITFSRFEPKCRGIVYNMTVNYLFGKPIEYEILIERSKINPTFDILVTVKGDGKIEKSELDDLFWERKLRNNKYFDYALLYECQILDIGDFWSAYNNS